MQYDLFTASQLSTDIEERKTIARLEHDERRFDDLCIIQDEIDQLIELEKHLPLGFMSLFKYHNHMATLSQLQHGWFISSHPFYKRRSVK